MRTPLKFLIGLALIACIVVGTIAAGVAVGLWAWGRWL